MDRTSKPIHTEDLPWMPLDEGVWVRPLRFSGEARSLQLKVAPGVTIGRHAHGGEVHAFNVSGSRRLGGGDIAGPGAYVYEPAGNVDSWTCVGDEPCVVQISMSGRLAYLGDGGKVRDVTDTPKLKSQYLAWCRENGHEPWAIGAAD
ncbi:MAG: cupin domain-containing protein [Kiloniellaceae bacterium]